MYKSFKFLILVPMICFCLSACDGAWIEDLMGPALEGGGSLEKNKEGTNLRDIYSGSELRQIVIGRFGEGATFEKGTISFCYKSHRKNYTKPLENTKTQLIDANGGTFGDSISGYNAESEFHNKDAHYSYLNYSDKAEKIQVIYLSNDGEETAIKIVGIKGIDRKWLEKNSSCPDSTCGKANVPINSTWTYNKRTECHSKTL